MRISDSKKKGGNESNKLLKERIDLKKEINSPQIDDDLKQKIEERIKQIEMKIGSEVSGKHHEDVVETLKSLGGDKHCLDGKYPKMSPLLPVVTWV